MENLFLTNQENVDFYFIALEAKMSLEKQLEKDYKFKLPKDIIEKDEKRLEVAKKLLDFARKADQAILITEIEMPF